MTLMVSICTYPRCSTAAAVACAPSPKGAGVSSRWARSQISLASALDRGCDLRAGDIVRECSRIRVPEAEADFRSSAMGGAKPRAQEKAAPPEGSAAEPLHSRSYFAELIFWTFM